MAICIVFNGCKLLLCTFLLHNHKQICNYCKCVQKARQLCSPSTHSTQYFNLALFSVCTRVEAEGIPIMSLCTVFVVIVELEKSSFISWSTTICKRSLSIMDSILCPVKGYLWKICAWENATSICTFTVISTKVRTNNTFLPLCILCTSISDTNVHI